MTERITIIGAGAWGTALALAAHRAGNATRIWARDPDAAAAINNVHNNPTRLTGVELPEDLNATAVLDDALDADAILLATPAQTTRALAKQLRGLDKGVPVVLCAKGLERATGLRLSEVMAETAPGQPVAVLSGPGFAADVAGGKPTAVTVAAREGELADRVCRMLASPTFRPYAETDVTGVELGGAIKNVLAIASGIVVGRSLGASAQSALIARGFAELRRLASVLGADGETLMGLSGLGDLVLTCTSTQSRNFSFGLELGQTGPDATTGALVEGASTATAAQKLAAANRIDMPIVDAVCAILDHTLSIDAAIERLLARPLRRERD